MLGDDKLNKILESLVGHKICITHLDNQGGMLRETSGVLVEIDKELIVIEIYDNYGHKNIYHLNRKACQLYSITDEGKKKK